MTGQSLPDGRHLTVDGPLVAPYNPVASESGQCGLIAPQLNTGIPVVRQFSAILAASWCPTLFPSAIPSICLRDCLSQGLPHNHTQG